MPWIYLLLAGIFEIGFAIGLKYTEGFTRLWPSVGTIVAAGISLWLLTQALRTIPVGTAYAVWTGIGAVGVAALGVLAGLRGDGWNLGFVVETERQVEAHLEEHLQTLPQADLRSREILKVMKADEARHAENAEQAGARLLPRPIPKLMAAASNLMKAVAYRL